MTIKSKDLLIDIGVTLVVFIVAVALLGWTNYRNNSSDSAIAYEHLDTDVVLYETVPNNSLFLLQSEQEATAIFPTLDATIDWDKQVVLGYIEHPQPTSGYSLEVSAVKKQGQLITVDYQLLFPSPDSVNLTVLTQPTLFIALNRTDLVTSNQMTVRFYNQLTAQTTSLSISPDEIV